ncbi:STAS domain-containing protein [Streptomyces sp. WI03-4A]|uniref:STAS domain-containing protein n=1 Tax=Streptomyces TaxID=1883 RepID=UPI0029BB2134|nr:STAS domain-containing protein [Streptomyces sp. WI03-4A]MDX2592977.1 STAS domain-containing protein [Streptomyces sp. WI03-4A]
MNETEGTLAISAHPSPGGPVVLRLAGELDHHTGARLGRAVEDLLRSPGAGDAGIVADLSRLHYCDSTGITTIITAHDRARATGSSFCVAAPSPAIGQLFRMTGLDQILTFHPSVEDAVEALSSG